MRHLTKNQKQLLDIWCAGHFDIGGFNGARDVDIRTWNKLRKLNDTEILYQEANRYIDDTKDEIYWSIDRMFEKDRKEFDLDLFRHEYIALIKNAPDTGKEWWLGRMREECT